MFENLLENILVNEKFREVKLYREQFVHKKFLEISSSYKYAPEFVNELKFSYEELTSTLDALKREWETLRSSNKKLVEIAIIFEPTNKNVDEVPSYIVPAFVVSNMTAEISAINVECKPENLRVRIRLVMSEEANKEDIMASLRYIYDQVAVTTESLYDIISNNVEEFVNSNKPEFRLISKLSQ